MAIKDKVPKGAEIRKLRESAGITQTQAAESMFVTLRTWQHWEAGNHKMRILMWVLFQTNVENDYWKKKK